MAAKKNNTPVKVTKAQITKIWDSLDASLLLGYAQSNNPSTSFFQKSNNVLAGLCPVPSHQDTNPSFFVDTARRFAKCYGCGFYTTNPVEITALVGGQTLEHAVEFIRAQCKIALTSDVDVTIYNERHTTILKETVYEEANAFLLEGLELGVTDPYMERQKALNWIINDRKLDPEIIPHLPIGILPPLTILMPRLTQLTFNDDEYTKLYGIQAIMEAAGHSVKNTVQDIISHNLSAVFRGIDKYAYSLVFPYYTSINEISSLKFRQAGTKHITSTTDPNKNPAGLYAAGHKFYHDIYRPENHEYNTCYLVEGEFDALTVMQKFAKKEWDILPFFGTGGTAGGAHLNTYIKSFGFNYARIVADSPEGNGDLVVEQLIDGIEDVPVSIFTGWSPFYPSKDPDETINSAPEKAIKFWELVRDPASYKSISDWMIYFTIQENKNTSSDDFNRYASTVIRLGKKIHSKRVRDTYLKEAATLFSLDLPDLRQGLSSKSKTEEGSIHSLADAIREEYHIIAHTAQGNTRKLMLQDKKHKNILRIQLENTTSAAQEFAYQSGGSIAFVRKYVGFGPNIIDPQSIAEAGGDAESMENASSLQKLHKTAGFYLSVACSILCLGTPDYDYANKLRQGYHYLPQSQGRPPLEYLVCGSRIIRIRRQGDGTPAYDALDGLFDEGYVFDLGISPGDTPTTWYPGGIDIPKLKAAEKIDLGEIYDKIVKIYDTGFTFKNQEATTQLLAGLLLTFPIASAFSRQPLVFITGDSNSGKSTLLSTLHCESYSPISLLWGPRYRSNYTAASLTFEGNLDTRPMLLDEFEFGDSKAAIENQKTLELYRGLVGGTVAKTRGTSAGGRINYYIKHPVVFAAIAGAEKTQDLNRMLYIEMKHVPGKDAPASSILRKFKEEEISQLAAQLNLALYPRVPELLYHAKEIERMFPEIRKTIDTAVEYRYISGFFPVLGLLKMIGRDWLGFFTKFLAANSDKIVQAATVSESDTILNKMLYNSCIKDAANANNVSVARLLGDSNRRNEVNNASRGVYYDELTHSLLIHIEQAYTNLLPPDVRAKGFSSQQLRETLSRHKLAIPVTKAIDRGAFERSFRFIGYGIRPHDVVVIDITDRLGLDSKPIAPTTQTPQTPEDEEITLEPGVGDSIELT